MDEVAQDAELMKWCTKAFLGDESMIELLHAKKIIDSMLIAAEECHCDTSETEMLFRSRAKAPLLYSQCLSGSLWEPDLVEQSIKVLEELDASA